MNSEIKDNLFTSSQASVLLGMSVQTLREWQRKKYIPLLDTGGWQRYRVVDLLAVSTMSHLLDIGLTHEFAGSIAALSIPMLNQFVKNYDEGKSPPKLVVATGPNLEPMVQVVTGSEDLLKAMNRRTPDGTSYMAYLVTDLLDVFEEILGQLNRHVEHREQKMFWKDRVAG